MIKKGISLPGGGVWGVWSSEVTKIVGVDPFRCSGIGKGCLEVATRRSTLEISECQTERLRFETVLRRFETNPLQFETEPLQFETERVQFETERLRYQTEQLRFETEHLQCQTERFRCEA